MLSLSLISNIIKMSTLKSIFCLFSIFLFFGCSNNSPSDLQEVSTMTNFTYQNSVKAIISTNCLNCHGAVPTSGSPMSLHTYETVKEAVLNRGLIIRLNLPEGNIMKMPLGAPKLSQSQIDAVTKWQLQNFQN